MPMRQAWSGERETVCLYICMYVCMYACIDVQYVFVLCGECLSIRFSVISILFDPCLTSLSSFFYGK